jgi:Tfp pilus assembly protein PilF
LLAPEDYELWLDYGKYLWKIKFNQLDQIVFTDSSLTQEIERAFLMAVTLNPDDYEIMDWLAWYYYRVDQDLYKSKDLLMKALINGGKEDPWVNYHLARVYDDLGNTEIAHNYYKIAYSLNPRNHSLIPNQYVQFLVGNGKGNLAIDILEETLLPLEPKNPVHFLRLVILYGENCNLEKANQYYEIAELLEPSKNSAIYEKAKESITNSSCE